MIKTYTHTEEREPFNYPESRKHLTGGFELRNFQRTQFADGTKQSLSRHTGESGKFYPH